MRPNSSVLSEVRRLSSCFIIVLAVGCAPAEYREGVMKNDPAAVVALKEAGANVRQVPVPGPGSSGLARSIDLTNITFSQ